MMEQGVVVTDDTLLVDADQRVRLGGEVPLYDGGGKIVADEHGPTWQSADAPLADDQAREAAYGASLDQSEREKLDLARREQADRIANHGAAPDSLEAKLRPPDAR
jgi:hypothetical protein